MQQEIRKQENQLVKDQILQNLQNKTVFRIKRTQSMLSTKEQKPLPFLLQKAIDYLGRENFAVMLVIFAQFLYPTGFLYANQNNLQFIQTTLARGIASIIIIYPIILFYKVPIDFKNWQDFQIINTRNTIIVIHSFVFTLAQFYLQQPILQTLNSCGPIFIFVIDFFLNGVKINHKQFVGVLFAILGVLLTVNGQAVTHWLFNQEEANMQTEFENYYTKDPVVKVVAGFSVLFVIALWGYGQVITKKLTTLNFMHVNIHLAAYLSIASGLFYPSLVTNPVQLSKVLWAIIWCGIPTTVASIAFIGAVTISKNTGVLTLFVSVSVINGYIVSIFRYKQSVNALCLCGTILLVIGLFKTVMNKEKPQKK